MEKMPYHQKHLVLEHKELGQCFMKLKDVLEVCPEFETKDVFEMLDKHGKSTKEHYVKCRHVKKVVDDSTWHKIHSEIYYDWYKLQRDSDITLILLKVVK